MSLTDFLSNSRCQSLRLSSRCSESLPWDRLKRSSRSGVFTIGLTIIGLTIITADGCQAKMSLSVLKIVRECVPNAMTTVDFTQFKAIMEVDSNLEDILKVFEFHNMKGLVAKVFSTLVDDGKKIVHAATAANLACLMRCGGYSSFVFEDAIRQLSHEWVERKPFCHFMLEEMLRFQCPFPRSVNPHSPPAFSIVPNPSRYPVTRAIRFLALAIEDLSVARRVATVLHFVRQKC